MSDAVRQKMKERALARHARKREARLRKYGTGPYVCYFCREPITQAPGRSPGSLLLHHVDGDKANNAPENRVTAHHRCHLEYHARLKAEALAA